MKSGIQVVARTGAYLIALLLALVWTSCAIPALARPLGDIAQPVVGDVIITFGHLFALSPSAIVLLAKSLAAFKLLIGGFLLAAVVVAAFERIVHGISDDALLDVALWMSAVGSLVSVIPALGVGGEPLQGVIGELMLAAIASTLAIYARGYLVPVEHEKPARREPVIISA